MVAKPQIRTESEHEDHHKCLPRVELSSLFSGANCDSHPLQQSELWY